METTSYCFPLFSCLFGIDKSCAEPNAKLPGSLFLKEKIKCSKYVVSVYVDIGNLITKQHKIRKRFSNFKYRFALTKVDEALDGQL